MREHVGVPNAWLLQEAAFDLTQVHQLACDLDHVATSTLEDIVAVLVE
jgi:hypothetical protein